MKIQTMSIVVGDTRCNAHCPYCISKITPTPNLNPTEVNWRNFNIARKLAKQAGTTTVLLTGKGEPTLYPELISTYLRKLQGHDFPFIELQTNGIRIGNGDLSPDGYNFLQYWYDLGLTTIALSAVSHLPEPNKEIYSKDHPGIEAIVKKIHNVGLMTRLSVMMMKGYIDTPDKVRDLIYYCKQQKIKQLTIRSIDAPDVSENNVHKWAKEHILEVKQLSDIKTCVQDLATPILYLAHGAIVYDFDGQNVCLSNCLTTNITDEDLRQIIFFPDGTISYDWKYRAAVLL